MRYCGAECMDMCLLSRQVLALSEHRGGEHRWELWDEPLSLFRPSQGPVSPLLLDVWARVIMQLSVGCAASTGLLLPLRLKICCTASKTLLSLYYGGRLERNKEN